jgi:hypothetical protein
MSWVQLLVIAGAVTAPARGNAKPAKLPWMKAPGPIAGTWKASCPASEGLQIQFTLEDDTKAVGRIVELGAASKYGYKQGEEIFRLTADDYGDWVGQLKWRSVAGAERWEPIRLVATPERLDATMTIDDCYRNMQKAH